MGILQQTSVPRWELSSFPVLALTTKLHNILLRFSVVSSGPQSVVAVIWSDFHGQVPIGGLACFSSNFELNQKKVSFQSI